MLAFSNCKINLGLHVLSKREDGFHDLETIFYPLNFFDAIEVLQVSSHQQTPEFNVSGLTIAGEKHDNLCIKAIQLLKNDFPNLPSMEIGLHKTIPIGAGLGGGSANAAFTLKLLNKKFQLGQHTHQLLNYAEKLGSDCPFFIINKPCLGTGRGNVLKPINLSLAGYKLVIIYPKIHIHTAWAFKNILPNSKRLPLESILEYPVEEWKERLINDFEQLVFKHHPALAEIKQVLYHHGAVYASMSGSGSTIYGLFEKDKSINISFDQNYFIKEVELE